jgi:hypothetical protein
MPNGAEIPPEHQIDDEMSVYLEHRQPEQLRAVEDEAPGSGMNPAHQMPARGMLDPVDTAGTAEGDMPRPSMG